MALIGHRMWGLGAALMAFAAGALAATSAPAGAASPAEPAFHAAVVRNDEPGCEPNCPQWISIEGPINGASAGKLRKALKLAGNLRLPVVISSSGGNMEAALAMGNDIRKRGLPVVIGVTLFSGCAPSEVSCKLPRAQKGVYRGRTRIQSAYCASACGFIFASGSERAVVQGQYLGVHQITSSFTEHKQLYRVYYKLVKGKKREVSRKLISDKRGKTHVTTRLSKSYRKQLAAYVSRMGVDQSMLALMETARPADMHWLTTAEMESTKLVTTFASVHQFTGTAICKGEAPAPNCVRVEPAPATP